MLFDDLDSSSLRPAGLNAGQNDLFVLLSRIGGEAGEWTGSRAELAKALGCSCDTVTRRKDRLVELGLVAVTPVGRMLRYAVLRRAVGNELVANRMKNKTPHPNPLPGLPGRRDRSARRWWSLLDADQLDLDFGPDAQPATRLAATTMQWIGLVVALVVGPKARPTTSTTIDAETSVEPTTSTTSDVQPTTKPTASTTLSEAQPTTLVSTIETTSIPTTTMTTTKPQISKTTNTNGSSSNFRLWRNAKAEEFQDPHKVQEVFERHHKAGLSTVDQRLAVFRCVVSLAASAKPSDDLPALITSVLRSKPSTMKFGPWFARGTEVDEQRAREMIRVVDGTAARVRTGDLSEDLERRKSDQRLALLSKYGR